MDLLSYTPETWIENEEILMKNLQNTSWKNVPSLNQIDFNDLRDGQLVRFTGMVQDMHSPEYYVDSYVSTNTETNEKTVKCGKYSEIIKCSDNESMNLYDHSVVRKELQTFYVISTPAENQWVKDVEVQNHVPHVDNNPPVNTQKRSLEDDIPMDLDNTVGSIHQKKQCNDQKEVTKSNINMSAEYILNFPIENKEGKACLAKVYNKADEIKLNEVCEFIGFLRIDPELSHECALSEDIETQLHNPSPSLIPRMHCLSFKKLKHANPLIDNVEINEQKFLSIRKDLMIVLTQLLLGDEIAAEYLLLYLISEVYIRRDLMALGKFSLNISNIPVIENLNYVEKLYEIIQLLVPKSHYLPLTIENLNELQFVPKKDYDSNRLNSGLLQLSSNTKLVLDETRLQAGKLGPAGVKAVQAIANVINTQRLSYDFNYYPVEFDCDIPILVASEGKSMLPSDCHVVLKPDEIYLETFDESIEVAKQFLKPDLLNEIRKYLTLCRFTSYDIKDNAHTLIQNKFVEMRQQGDSPEDLHNLLVLNRLITLSYGKNSLDDETWNMACKLEEVRKQRLQK